MKHYPHFNTEAITDAPLTVYKTHVGIAVMADRGRALFTMEREAARAFATDILVKLGESE